jgi:hypothetical protein
MRLDEAWWFPEVDHGHHLGAIPRHPRRIIELVPDMVGQRIVTVSEHIILAFQKLVRIGRLEPEQLQLYCGNNRVSIDNDGDLVDWPGPFFDERLSLLR